MTVFVVVRVVTTYTERLGVEDDAENVVGMRRRRTQKLISPNRGKRGLCTLHVHDVINTFSQGHEVNPTSQS